MFPDCLNAKDLPTKEIYEQQFKFIKMISPNSQQGNVFKKVTI